MDTYRDCAAKAFSKVKVVKGRPVQLCFAKKKLTSRLKKDRALKKEEQEEKKEEEDSEEEDDYETLTSKNGESLKRRKARSERGKARFDVGRVVVVKNLPPGARERKIRRRCERRGTVEDITFPISSSQPDTAHVTFTTHSAARAAVASLSKSRYSKKRDEVLEAVLLSRQNKSVSSKTLNKSRVVVRNISFKSDEGNIRTAFEKFGNVLDIHIPRKDNGHMLG